MNLINTECSVSRAMQPSTEAIEKAFTEGPVISMDGYNYFVSPLSDGIPSVTKQLLDEIADNVVALCKLDCDMLLAPEAMGIPIASAVTMRTGIPYSVIRKRQYLLPGEITLFQATGYSKAHMYINGVNKGDRVVIVDDVVSTGGTLKATVKALKDHGITVTEICVIFDKCADIRTLSEEIGVPIRAILKVAVVDGRPTVLRRLNPVGSV